MCLLYLRVSRYTTVNVLFPFRQMVARSLLETIRSVGDSREDANKVLQAMVNLAQDPGIFKVMSIWSIM